MRWQSHAIIAFFSSIIILFFMLGITDIFQLLLFSAFALIAGLVPDIDHGESRGRKFLDSAVIVAILFFAYASACAGDICLPGLSQLQSIAIMSLILFGLYFLFIIFIMPRHRGFTHSLVACLGFCVLIYLLAGRFFALAGLIGYLSHLVADGEFKPM